MAQAKPKAKTKAKAKKKVRKEVGSGTAYIQSTFNNTIITITDHQGNALCWTSAGTAGFKGARKGTPFAAQLAAKEASNRARDFGVRYVDVRIKGPGAGRESAIRALQSAGMEIRSIKDVTPIPHNGCRVRRRRRV
jgi:small subunit ribosomal protein S11